MRLNVVGSLPISPQIVFEEAGVLVLEYSSLALRVLLRRWWLCVRARTVPWR